MGNPARLTINPEKEIVVDDHELHSLWVQGLLVLGSTTAEQADESAGTEN